ncbi:MAG: ribonuclease III [Candidatus Gracilibacteria bacterium]|jgi:ribonuclease-3
MSDYKILEKKIGIKLKDKAITQIAFTHKSYINEHKNEGLEHNERIEFLGDAVLELAVTDHLFEKYPTQTEGQMTSFRSALVKGQHLAEIARELNLGEYLFLSNGEERSGGREKSYILGNTLESLIGAIYLMHGYDVAEKFIKEFVLTRLDQIIRGGSHIDSKSKFQEISQEKESFTPYYQVLSEEGPDHNKKFTMGVYIKDELVAKGTGKSKQLAEENAACNALKKKKWN